MKQKRSPSSEEYIINKASTSNSSLNFEFCNYRSTTERSLEQHIHDKHKGSKNSNKTSKNGSNIPCDVCNHVSKSATDHKKHADEKHSEFQKDSKKCQNCDDLFQKEEELKKHEIEKHGNKMLMIPCDECTYVAKNTEDFLRHVKHHTSERRFQCEVCNKITNSIEELRQHIKRAHNDEKTNREHLNLKHNQDNGFNSKKDISLNRICMFWNRGFCRFEDSRCRYVHMNLPPCRFQEKCFRLDCKYFHEKETKKFPF